MKIKIEYEIELTDAQVSALVESTGIPADGVIYWLQGFMPEAAKQRLSSLISTSIGEIRSPQGAK